MENSSRMATACFMMSQSLDEPMMTPTTGARPAAASRAAGVSMFVLMIYLALLVKNGRGPGVSAGQSLERFTVLGGRLFEDVCRQTRRRRRLVPGLCFEPVAHELLVVRRRADAFGVTFCRPESRGIRREHLVHEVQLTVFVETKLELGVGDDDALAARVFRSLGIEPQRDITQLCSQLGAHCAHHIVEIDVLVMQTELGLCCRREDRFGQAAGQLQAFGKRNATDAARGL